jgi:hypothetical protein
VLIWNSWPTSGLQNADLVLGQPDMTINTANNGGVSAQSLYNVSDVFSDGTRLFVADTYNHRVLQWNTFPTTSRQPADLVLGQPDMISNTSNAGAALCRNSPMMGSQQIIPCPQSVFSDGTKLYVGENGDLRVMIWNSIPAANLQGADLELGRSSFVDKNDVLAVVSGTNFAQVSSVTKFGNRLYVSDASRNRVLYWDEVKRSDQPADGVIGQPDFTSISPLSPLDASSLAAPIGLSATAERLYVVDSQHQRLLALSPP